MGAEAWTDPWARSKDRGNKEPMYFQHFCCLSIYPLSINCLYGFKSFWTRTLCPSFLADETVPQFFQLNEMGSRGLQGKDSLKNSSTLYFLILTMPCFSGPGCRWYLPMDSSQHLRASGEEVLHRGDMNHKDFLSRDIQATVQIEKNV